MTKARDLANGGFGLVLIKPSTVVNGTDNGKGTVTFSAQTSVSLNNVFNSTYKNYRMFITATSSAGETDCNFRLRANGSDVSTSSYNFSEVSLGANGTSYNRSGGLATSGAFGRIGGNGLGHITVDIAAPQIAQRTTTTSRSAADGSTSFFNASIASNFVSTTQFDGITIILTGGGTMTGTVSVYGYNE
jgi:hypothetical protein